METNVLDYRKLARKIASDDMVLLKNNETNGEKSLPLCKETKVALFGIAQIEHARGYAQAWYDLPSYVPGGGGAAEVISDHNVSPLEGFRNAAYENRFQLNMKLAQKYELFSSDKNNAHELLFTTEEMSHISSVSDTAVFIISRYSSEADDRIIDERRGAFNLLQEEKDLLNTILSSNFKKTIVVLNIAGVMDTEWFANNDKIDAALVAWLPGQEGGDAIADILCGKVNPSGKLPDTFAKKCSDYKSSENYGTTEVVYAEDIFIGYRYFETFDKDCEKVNYPFGFGLSYTEFKFSDMTFLKTKTGIKVSVTVINCGKYAGREVVQLYISAPQGKLGKPVKELKAFKKTTLLACNESQTITMNVSFYEMSSYDDTGKSGNESCYVLEEGYYDILIGNSIRNVNKIGHFFIERTIVTAHLTKRLTPIKSFRRLCSDGSYELIEAGLDTSANPCDDEITELPETHQTMEFQMNQLP